MCTRPFRAKGPRVEAERVGDKLIVHNYGHGGSGWSLSWGSGTAALELAFAGREPAQTDVAVIGCGALGLTSAILAQRAGARSVTIYAKDQPSDTRSFRATGAWTPDSRVALTSAMSAGFPAEWDRMTRTSWGYYQGLLDLPGRPIEFADRYVLSDVHPGRFEQQKREEDPIGFAWLHERVPDVMPRFEDLAAGSHPFPTRWARRRRELRFNITEYARHLTEDFRRNGGRMVMREFHSPSEFAELPQPVIVHATGYAARGLFGDRSLTPVRGQIGWLPAQAEVNYGLFLENLNILSRGDGIVVQLNAQGEASGWNEENEQPDRGEAEEGVRQLRVLYEKMAAMREAARHVVR